MSLATLEPIQAMALYNQQRVHQCLNRLVDKPVWQPQDTAEFDCMHYEGDTALDRAVKCLSAQKPARILDVGSGYGGTGRYLYRRYGLETIGLELQSEIHSVADRINRRAAITTDTVRSVQGNILEPNIRSLIGSEPFDYIVSFLCILHIPHREQVFSRMASLLKPGGRIYIEDYAARRPLSEQESNALKEIVACPYLPDVETYCKQAENTGFHVVEKQDLTQKWTQFVADRAAHYEQRNDKIQQLQVFYRTVKTLFDSGAIAGLSLTLQRN